MAHSWVSIHPRYRDYYDSENPTLISASLLLIVHLKFAVCCVFQSFLSQESSFFLQHIAKS